MADSLDYLSSDFDLNSLTVPRLRSILVSHDVPYPASAKKAQLVRILEEEVLPQARKLLRERERVRRTSEGITDMGSRATSVASDYDDQRGGADRESMPPPPTPSTVSTTTGGRRPRTKRSTRGSTADTEEGRMPATPSTVSRRMAPRSEARLSRTSEIPEEAPATPVVMDATTPRRSTARKVRRSEMTPSTEQEPPVSSIKTEPKDESIFTYDNPFQSGSPAHWDQPRSSLSAKRKSTSRFSLESPAKEGLRSQRSETPGSIKKEYHSTPRSSFDYSAPPLHFAQAQLEDQEDYYDSEASAGEEFTPEEQLALEREQADRMYPPITTTRQTPRKQGTASKVAPWVVILGLLGGFAAWWRQEKVEIGFCGIGKPTWSLAETKVPEWAKVLEPACEPCPPHAFCYPNFQARCEHDFLLKPHPLSLGGLVPLPPTCEPDSEKARRVKAVADKAVEELRDRRAKWECGELTEDGQNAKSPEISVPDLKDEVANKRRKGMTDSEFDELWKGALGEIVGRDEIVSKTQPTSSELVLTSTSISRLPLTCAFRRHIRLSLLAYRLPLSILIACASALVYIRSRVLARRSDIARVPELVATTLNRLATQAALHARGDAREPYISVGQLRDDVLRSELQGSRREELWRRVRNVIEGNANIRAAVREGRGGDVARVWEWIGGIGSVGGEVEGSARRRDSSRAQFSAPSNNEQQNSDIAVENGDQGLARSPRESRHWDEGRPIY